tara:strand:+ start:174 stop:740 length:567 start_codon:yes stop_codon:yes gene_type:complete
MDKIKTFGELDLINNINIDFVKKILDENNHLWDIDESRQKNFAVHKKTKSIILIWTDNNNKFDKKINNNLITLFNPFIDDLLNKLKQKFNYDNYCILKLVFVKLLPHSDILPHIDGDKMIRLPNRIHIPIISNSDVITNINDKQFYMKPGNIYNFNNTLIHGINNKSDICRVHCIIDYMDKKVFDEEL